MEKKRKAEDKRNRRDARKAAEQTVPAATVDAETSDVADEPQASSDAPTTDPL